MNGIWPNIIIAAITAFITWFFNRLTIIAEIRKAQKDKINENRIKLYTKCYEILEQNLANTNIVFENDYRNSLIEIKAQMKLLASNHVLHAFTNYYTWASSVFNDYISFCHEKDPIEFYTVTGPDGTEDEVPAFNESDLETFRRLADNYIVERNIEDRTVRSKIQSILDAMRDDLGNDKYTEDFHI